MLSLLALRDAEDETRVRPRPRLAMPLVGVAFILAPAAAAVPAALPAPVTLDGIGGVRPGITPAQVAARWGLGSDGACPSCARRTAG